MEKLDSDCALTISSGSLRMSLKVKESLLMSKYHFRQEFEHIFPATMCPFIIHHNGMVSLVDTATASALRNLLHARKHYFTTGYK